MEKCVHVFAIKQPKWVGNKPHVGNEQKYSTYPCVCFNICLLQTLWSSAWSCFAFSLIFMVPEHLSELSLLIPSLFILWQHQYKVCQVKYFNISLTSFQLNIYSLDLNPLTTSISCLGNSYIFLCECGALVWPCDGNWCGHFRPDLPRKQHCANVLFSLSLWLQSVFISWMC